MLALLEDEHQQTARKDLLSFTAFTFPEYEINWHHRLLCNYLNDFIAGRIKRLMIFMPPRHGKSELVSRRLPAFLLGKNPDLNIILASYSDTLSSKMNRDVQRIILDHKYQALFPNTKIGGKREDGAKYLLNSEMFEVCGRRGFFRSAGIGSGITGMGAHVAIIDDPVKDKEEADSPTYRERAWSWYQMVLRTRLEKDAQILLTMTRWHEDDLAGKLLKQMKTIPDSEQWTILKMPAIKEDEHNPIDPRQIGEALWSEKFSQSDMALTKIGVGSRTWNALYQQEPSDVDGGIIKRDWVKYYDALPQTLDEIVQSWDFAVKDKAGSDFTVGQVWGRKGADKYLIYQIRGIWSFPDACQKVIMVTQKYPKAHRKLIEAKANGPAVIQTLKSRVSGLVEVEPRGDKLARVNAISPEFEAGNVYFPNPVTNPWVAETLCPELFAFPTAKNDDQVDAMTQALDHLRRTGPVLAPLAGHAGIIY